MRLKIQAISSILISMLAYGDAQKKPLFPNPSTVISNAINKLSGLKPPPIPPLPMKTNNTASLPTDIHNLLHDFLEGNEDLRPPPNSTTVIVNTTVLDPIQAEVEQIVRVYEDKIHQVCFYTYV